MVTEKEIEQKQLENEVSILSFIDQLFLAWATALLLKPLIAAYIRRGELVEFDNLVLIKQQIRDEVAKMLQTVYVTTTKGITYSWDLGGQLADAKVIGINSRWKNTHFQATSTKQAQEAFIKRRTKGLKLSDRVWKLQGQTETFIQNAIQMGIKDGKSAAKIGMELRQYLQNPDTFFRRVRTEAGELKLSRAAKKFNPGRGVNRSPKKNAERLARNEINKAYRTAERDRYLTDTGVVGYKISLSNNHTLNGAHFVDMCDRLAGVYPKTFVWSGWHVQCRCKMTPVLCTEDEFEQILTATQEGKEYAPPQITEQPESLKTWVAANKHRFKAGYVDWLDDNGLIK